jgi:hypothetical protein
MKKRESRLERNERIRAENKRRLADLADLPPRPPMVTQRMDPQGTEGQDRESYTDKQDRENYTEAP